MQTPEELLREAWEGFQAGFNERSIAASLLIIASGLVRGPTDSDMAAHEVAEAVEEFFLHPSEESHARLLQASDAWRATLG